jgi:hypothetical protein
MPGGAAPILTGQLTGGYLTGRALIFPLSLVISLFFLWGFSYGLLDGKYKPLSPSTKPSKPSPNLNTSPQQALPNRPRHLPTRVYGTASRLLWRRLPPILPHRRRGPQAPRLQVNHPARPLALLFGGSPLLAHRTLFDS